MQFSYMRHAQGLKYSTPKNKQPGRQSSQKKEYRLLPKKIWTQAHNVTAPTTSMGAFSFVLCKYSRNMEAFQYVPAEKLHELPALSGVYAFSSKHALLYIGKAANLRERVKNHFQQPTHRDHFFISSVEKIGYLLTRSSIEALLLESQLIKKHKPKYNVLWKDDKNYFYVILIGHPLPHIAITHRIPAQGIIRHEGPFVDGTSLKETLKLLRRIFPFYTSATHPKKICPWCQLKVCPGPFPDMQEYKKNLASLFAVLRGQRVSVLKNMKSSMEKASKEQDFEKAAKLRDQFLALENVVSHSPKPLHQRTSLEHAGKELQYIFNASKHLERIEAYDISNIQGKQATGSMVTFMHGKPAKEWYRKFKVHITGKPNDFAMMKEVIARRMKHEEWPYPDLMLIDGGKGQLSAALVALGNNPPFMVAALAKQHNELFVPQKQQPLLLKHMPPQAQNVLLYIRDEAHRFAITYHKKLRRNAFLDNT